MTHKIIPLSSRMKDITGMKFNMLTAIHPTERTPQNRIKWLCSCDCGGTFIALTAQIINGQVKSCGCLRSTFNGACAHPLWGTWKGIRDRCYRPNEPAYANYGGRGITMCERWLNDPFTFFCDMGDRPKGYSIDRIDNDGPYSPENCRWASRKTQSRNTRRNRHLTLNGETKCLSEWAEHTGLKVVTIHQRITRGWSVEKALSTPLAP